MEGLLRQHRLTLRTEVGPDLPQVRVPQRDLIQVLCNLIRNAIEASGPASEIRLSVAHDGESVSIIVADRGHGMPAEVLPHIFDPFFTTKEPGKGTGLGLHISHDIVANRHHGQLLVESQPGGTKFKVVLPVKIS